MIFFFFFGLVFSLAKYLFKAFSIQTVLLSSTLGFAKEQGRSAMPMKMEVLELCLWPLIFFSMIFFPFSLCLTLSLSFVPDS